MKQTKPVIYFSFGFLLAIGMMMLLAARQNIAADAGNTVAAITSDISSAFTYQGTLDDGSDHMVVKASETISIEDATQGVNDNGMVKAAVSGYCANIGSVRSHYFNNVNDSAVGILIFNGSKQGNCTIDFGFDLSQHFWTASNISSFEGFPEVWLAASCILSSTDNSQLNCEIGETRNGYGINSTISVVVH